MEEILSISPAKGILEILHLSMFLFSMQLTIMFSDPLDFGFGKISFVYISRCVSGFGIAPLPNNHQIATANAYRVFTLLTSVGLIVIFLTVYFAGFCLM